VITHFGVLVPDLEASIERYSNMLGVAFCAPNVAIFPHADHGTHVEEPARIRMTYSMSGPVYVELIEATGDGVWSARHGFGMHHFGGYAADLGAACAAAIQQGAVPECVVRAADGAHLLTYFAPGGLMGARLEVLTDRMRPAWEKWVAGGPPPGH
jgi:catechol 2,3-dioxygenase-like lactoylglutathione lyase family enzyme